MLAGLKRLQLGILGINWVHLAECFYQLLRPPALPCPLVMASVIRSLADFAVRDKIVSVGQIGLSDEPLQVH